MPTTSKGFVYFARSRHSGLIKIGITKDVDNRIAVLRRRTGEDVELLCCCAGTLKHERDLHARFAADAVGHEWFTPSRDLIEFVTGFRKSLLDRYDPAMREIMEACWGIP